MADRLWRLIHDWMAKDRAFLDSLLAYVDEPRCPLDGGTQPAGDLICGHTPACATEMTPDLGVEHAVPFAPDPAG
jgi:hypothetical protein